MKKYIIIEEGLLKFLSGRESQKAVGKCLKRVDIHSGKEEIKKAIKEVLYESYRDLIDYIIDNSKSKDAIHLINAEEEKK